MSEPTRPGKLDRSELPAISSAPSSPRTSPRASTAEGSRPLPPEPNGYLHIGHTRPCASTSAWRWKTAAPATCASTTPTPQGGCRIRRGDQGRHPLDGVRLGRPRVLCLGLLRQALRVRRRAAPRGKAYVCELTGEQMREYRGTLTQPAAKALPAMHPSRRTSTSSAASRAGEFPTGPGRCGPRSTWHRPTSTCATRLSTASCGRITTARATRGALPMYDFTHCLSDMLEGSRTRSARSTFEDHRTLYDWFLDVLETPCHPQQIEVRALEHQLHDDEQAQAARKLVEEGIVSGWDDRACRPCAACGAGATRPPPSAPSWTKWAWPSATA